MTPELQRILQRQQRWAQHRDVEVLDSGHTAELAANLFEPLAGNTREELGFAQTPRENEAEKPVDLQLLDSTLSLLCNAFDTLRDQPERIAALCDVPASSTATCFAPPIADLGVSGDAESSTGLESERSVGLLLGDGASPDEGRPIAICASYCEPYRSERPRRAPANRTPSAWLDDTEAWRELPGCRHLALDLRYTPRRYQHIPAADLLARGVALTRRFGHRGFRLVHIWYEVPGHSAAHYRQELERLRFRIGGELDLRFRTWQQVIADLALGAGDPAHVEYMKARYDLG